MSAPGVVDNNGRYDGDARVAPRTPTKGDDSRLDGREIHYHYYGKDFRRHTDHQRDSPGSNHHYHQYPDHLANTHNQRNIDNEASLSPTSPVSHSNSRDRVQSISTHRDEPDYHDDDHILRNSQSFGKISEQPHIQKTRQRLGLHPTIPVIDEHDEAPHQEYLWSKIKLVLREPFAEFWGTFILIMFGNGSVAQVLLSTGQTAAPGGMGFGSYQSISWGWGIGIMLGIYVAGDSGAYLNPAVTFCSCLYRKLPWRRFPLYFLAQILGAFCASGVVYANYLSAIDNLEGYGVRTVPPSATATAGIFCTYPQAFLTKTGQFFSEFIASAVLMFVIFALKDNANMGGGKGDRWFPLALFFLIFGIGACFGWETGYAINLARDFGPRLMSYALGYGHEVWSAGGYYFWIPMVAPFIGCAFGGFLYDAFIYTGESPVNTPWVGLKRIFSPKVAAEARRQRVERAKSEGMV